MFWIFFYIVFACYIQQQQQQLLSSPIFFVALVAVLTLASALSTSSSNSDNNLLCSSTSWPMASPICFCRKIVSDSWSNTASCSMHPRLIHDSHGHWIPSMYCVCDANNWWLSKCRVLSVSSIGWAGPVPHLRVVVVEPISSFLVTNSVKCSCCLIGHEEKEYVPLC